MVEFPSGTRRDVLRSKKNWKRRLETDRCGDIDEEAYAGIGLMLELF